MGGIGTKDDRPNKDTNEPKKSPVPIEDDIEDGDIATPKRDRDDADDQPA
jgi:hypothetical protein